MPGSHFTVLPILMSFRRIQRLAAKAMSTLAAVAVVLSQPVLPVCACTACPAEVCCSSRAKAACSCCEASSVAAVGCCGEGESIGIERPQCTCSAWFGEAPASAPNSPVRVVDVEGSSLHLPATMVAAHAGLHGAPWATAFDLEALGNPPGLRLHALLCVWRN